MFSHKKAHKGTWKSLDAQIVSQIHHIELFRRHRSLLLDVRSFRGADIGLTDHYLLRDKVRMKLKN